MEEMDRAEEVDIIQLAVAAVVTQILVLILFRRGKVFPWLLVQVVPEVQAIQGAVQLSEVCFLLLVENILGLPMGEMVVQEEVSQDSIKGPMEARTAVRVVDIMVVPAKDVQHEHLENHQGLYTLVAEEEVLVMVPMEEVGLAEEEMEEVVVEVLILAEVAEVVKVRILRCPPKEEMVVPA